MTSRLEQLLQMQAEDPDDPFLAYGIALEIAKTDLPGGVAKLRQLVETHPEYLPPYYRLGAFLSENSQDEEALTYLRLGLELAKVQNETMAAREIQAMIDEIEF